MNIKFFNRFTIVVISIFFCSALLFYSSAAIASERPIIFPIPQEMEVLDNHFKLDVKSRLFTAGP